MADQVSYFGFLTAPSKPAKKNSNKSVSQTEAGSKTTAVESSKKTARRMGAGNKFGRRGSAGILAKAKEALKSVLAGGRQWRAEGAVAGAAEAGKKVTGVDPGKAKSKQSTKRAVKK